MGTGNYSAISINVKLVHWPLMGGLLHLVKRGRSTHSPLLAVPNVTAHPSAASVPITVLLYSGPWLCGFNVPIKGLNMLGSNTLWWCRGACFAVIDTSCLFFLS